MRRFFVIAGVLISVFLVIILSIGVRAHNNKQALEVCLVTFEHLKQNVFDSIEVEEKEKALVLYSWEKRKSSPGLEKVEIERLIITDPSLLRNIDRRIKDSASIRGGIFFATFMTFDGDWYGYYISEKPDVQWLTNNKAVAIQDSVYYIELTFQEVRDEIE